MANINSSNSASWGGGGGGGYEQELLYFESHQAIKWRFAGGPMLARL